MTAVVEVACVCGHPESEHEPAVLSVPLKGKDLYPPATTLMPVAVRRNDRATYDSCECHCGCMLFTPNDGETDWVHLARVDRGSGVM